MFFYVGTFTGGFMGGEPAEGIYVCWLGQDGEMELRQTMSGLISPSFLAHHPSLPILYAVERAWSEDDDNSGALSSFGIDAMEGVLQFAHRCRSGGSFPAHVSVHPRGRFAFVANPRSGTASAVGLDESGLPIGAVSTVRHEGHGPHIRQAGPWTHSVYPDPSGRHLLVCELGVDRVYVYDFDEDNGTLGAATQAYAQVSSGAGARHLAFHPNGRMVYVLNELDSTLSVFRYDHERGALSILETRATLPSGFVGHSLAAEVVIGPEGTTLYASNRGDASIASFAIDPASQTLGSVRHISSGGATPRHIAISRDGSMLLVANQHGSSIKSFRRGVEGELTPTGHSLRLPSPTCIVFGTSSAGANSPSLSIGN